jgi:hypothetical protein
MSTPGVPVPAETTARRVPAARPSKSRLRAPPEYSGPIGRRRSAVATHDVQPREWREWLGNRWILRPTNERALCLFPHRSARSGTCRRRCRCASSAAPRPAGRRGQVGEGQVGEVQVGIALSGRGLSGRGRRRGKIRGRMRRRVPLLVGQVGASRRR